MTNEFHIPFIYTNFKTKYLKNEKQNEIQKIRFCYHTFSFDHTSQDAQMNSSRLLSSFFEFFFWLIYIFSVIVELCKIYKVPLKFTSNLSGTLLTELDKSHFCPIYFQYTFFVDLLLFHQASKQASNSVRCVVFSTGIL